MRLLKIVGELDRQNLYYHGRLLYPTQAPGGDLLLTGDRSVPKLLLLQELPAIACCGQAIAWAAADMGLISVDGLNKERRPEYELIGRVLQALNPVLADPSSAARRARRKVGLPESIDAAELGEVIPRQNDRCGTRRSARGQAAGDSRGAWAKAWKALMLTVANPRTELARVANRNRTARTNAAAVTG